MAKTFQELSIEITQKAKAGTLTIGEAINFASNSIVPMPEGYAKNKKGEYPARNNIQTLKKSCCTTKKGTRCFSSRRKHPTKGYATTGNCVFI